MTRLATILLLAATINAQFAGDAAAGSKPKPRQTNWMHRCGKPKMSPRFNPRFTGYGKNKISWFASLRAASFKFAPVKKAFATHMPQDAGRARFA